MEVIHKTLRRYDKVSYHLGHIAQLDLPDTVFDVVVIHFVLHDIPAAERPGVIQALGRKLKPGGRLLLREPQGHALDLAEIKQLAAMASLNLSSLKAHKLVIGAVYDGCFIQERNIS